MTKPVFCKECKYYGKDVAWDYICTAPSFLTKTRSPGGWWRKSSYYYDYEVGSFKFNKNFDCTGYKPKWYIRLWNWIR